MVAIFGEVKTPELVVRCELGACPRSRVALCCQECQPVALCSARCRAWDREVCGWKLDGEETS